jgi:cephalosporin hydroxylase
MDDHEEFSRKCKEEISEQGNNKKLQSITRDWFNEATKHNYSYHFEWLGRPIIQFPQDILAIQQIIWSIKPDLIIETGIARGGSLIFYASILELIASCGGPKDSMVLGVDIDIRQHNKNAILSHPMSKRIEMLQGSSTDHLIAEQVIQRAKKSNKTMVCLDSNHTHDHVLKELRLYAPLVSVDSYLIVLDTVVDDLPSDLTNNRPWGTGNNPKTAVFEYLDQLNSLKSLGLDGNPLNFEIDHNVENQLLITVSPSGFLKRVG